MFKSLKGMADILPEEIGRWQEMEHRLRTIFHTFGYREIRTPILEETELFARSIGATTDVVEKEMFAFEDQGGTAMALRPESTAGVIRAYLENNLGHGSPLVKLYYMGPMFRHERPQKGRFRQFYQAGIEAIGSSHPLVDVEVMAILMKIGEAFALPDLKLQINSLGDETCRPAYRKKLQTFLRERKDKLCESCVRRIEINPMRVFDCKSPVCQDVVSKAPRILENLCAECSENFEQVKKGLTALKVPFEVNSSIVRGLDYYSRTAFEMTGGGLGSQNAVGGGGRYDGLANELGGDVTPAVGFAMGLERLLLSAEKFQPKKKVTRIDFIPLEPATESITFQLATDLREKVLNGDYCATIDINLTGGRLKNALRQSDKNNTDIAVIIGGNELEKKTATVKDLAAHTQKEIPFDRLTAELLKQLHA